jgi:hypothetical protein
MARVATKEALPNSAEGPIDVERRLTPDALLLKRIP